MSVAVLCEFQLLISSCIPHVHTHACPRGHVRPTVGLKEAVSCLRQPLENAEGRHMGRASICQLASACCSVVSAGGAGREWELCQQGWSLGSRDREVGGRAKLPRAFAMSVQPRAASVRPIRRLVFRRGARHTSGVWYMKPVECFSIEQDVLQWLTAHELLPDFLLLHLFLK